MNGRADLVLRYRWLPVLFAGVVMTGVAGCTIYDVRWFHKGKFLPLEENTRYAAPGLHGDIFSFSKPAGNWDYRFFNVGQVSLIERTPGGLNAKLSFTLRDEDSALIENQTDQSRDHRVFSLFRQQAQALKTKDVKLALYAICHAFNQTDGNGRAISKIIEVQGMGCVQTEVFSFIGGMWPWSRFFRYYAYTHCPVYVGSTPTTFTYTHSIIVPERSYTFIKGTEAYSINQELYKPLQQVLNSIRFHAPLSGWIEPDQSDLGLYCEYHG